jgi:hypothetical protein
MLEVGNKTGGVIMRASWLVRISLDAFYLQAKHYLRILEEEQEALLYSCKVVERGKDIWPDQCEHIIILMRRLAEPVQEFCQLLESPTRLPEAVVPLRYPLASALHSMDEQIRELISLLTRMHATRRISIAQRSRLQQEIRRRFEIFKQGYNDSIEKANNLFDQVRFKDKKIANL